MTGEEPDWFVGLHFSAWVALTLVSGISGIVVSPLFFLLTGASALGTANCVLEVRGTERKLLTGARLDDEEESS